MTELSGQVVVQYGTYQQQLKDIDRLTAERDEVLVRLDCRREENRVLQAKLRLMRDEYEERQEWAAKQQMAVIKRLRDALTPFSHPDLRLRLGGNSDREGAEAIVFQRNSAILRLKHFDAVEQALKGDSDA
jgi:hypothetical protein